MDGVRLWHMLTRTKDREAWEQVHSLVVLKCCQQMQFFYLTMFWLYRLIHPTSRFSSGSFQLVTLIHLFPLCTPSFLVLFCLLYDIIFQRGQSKNSFLWKQTCSITFCEWAATAVYCSHCTSTNILVGIQRSRVYQLSYCLLWHLCWYLLFGELFHLLNCLFESRSEVHLTASRADRDRSSILHRLVGHIRDLLWRLSSYCSSISVDSK